MGAEGRVGTRRMRSAVAEWAWRLRRAVVLATGITVVMSSAIGSVWPGKAYAQTPTSTTVASVSVTYSPSRFVVLSAKVVSSPSGQPVNGGVVTFTVTNSSHKQIGSHETVFVNSVGMASAVFTLPAGTPAGTYTIIAYYSPLSRNFAPSTGIGILRVSKDPQTISFSSSVPSTAVVGTTTYTPSATATSGLAVQFSIDSSTAGTCTISSGVVSFAGAGICVIDANQAGNTDYLSATQVQQSVTAAAQPSTTTITGPSSDIAGAPATFKVTVAGGDPPSGTVTLTTGSTELGTATLASSGEVSLTTTALPVGSDVVTAAYSGDTVFAASTGHTTVEVTPATTTAATTGPAPTTAATLTATPPAMAAPSGSLAVTGMGPGQLVGVAGLLLGGGAGMVTLVALPRRRKRRHPAG